MTTDDRGERDQLDGWKEIADYVRRSVRTAQRWERRYGLPVRRIQATGGEVVYAIRAEIDEWRNRQAHLLESDGSSIDAVTAIGPVVAKADATARPLALADSHVVYVSVQAVLFGFMVAEGLVAEMSYAFHRDGALALRFAPIAFAWSAACLAITCWIDTKMIRARRSEALFCAVGVFAAGMALMLIGLLPWLPSDATIQATFQTRTIQSGYLKNALYYFVPLVVVFVLPTFHAVVALEREAAVGDAANVAKLIRRESRSLPLQGVLLPRIFHFCVILVVAALWALATTNYLLDRLVPGPYMNLFSILVEIRVATWFVLALNSLTWYSSRLGSLLRAISGAVVAAADSDPPVLVPRAE